MRTLLFLTFFVCISTFSIAQVVNTENMRLSTDDQGWRGIVDVNFGITRNKAGQTLRFGGRARAEYLYSRSRWLVFGGYNITQFTNVDDPESVPKSFVNNRFAHLRYNRKISNLITWEAFTQTQHDEIQEIDQRILAGTGPRFRVVENDSVRLFLGALYMFEYEQSDEFFTLQEMEFEKDATHRHHRLSAYVSFGWDVAGKFTVNHVTYFQPRPDMLKDFRITTETTLNFQLTSVLQFKTYFQMVYDARPPNTVPRNMYMISNGLSVNF